MGVHHDAYSGIKKQWDKDKDIRNRFNKNSSTPPPLQYATTDLYTLILFIDIPTEATYFLRKQLVPCPSSMTWVKIDFKTSIYSSSWQMESLFIVNLSPSFVTFELPSCQP